MVCRESHRGMLITGVIIEEEDARKNTPQKTQKTTKGSTAEVTLGLHITLHFLQSTFILLGWGFFFSLGFFFTALVFFSILPWAMVPYPSLLTPIHSCTPFQSPFSNSALVSNSTEILTLHAVLFHLFINFYLF